MDLKKEKEGVWICNHMSEPITKGYYTCLVEIDDYGTLSDQQECYYDGMYWSNYESGVQFTRYWLAKPHEYAIITKRLDKMAEEFFIETKFGN